MSSSLHLPGPGANPDVSAVIAGLFIYPIKSCGGIALPEADLDDQGLELDRNWMVVDAQGQFMTQRQWPRMALIQPSLRTDDMVLRAPGMLALHLSLYEVQDAVRVQVWNDQVPAFDMGPVAAQWFSVFLGVTGARLVRFDPDHQRPSSSDWTGEHVALNQFSDGYPMLLTSQASLDGLNERLAAAGEPVVTMARFRPNIVLGPAPGATPWLPHDEDRLQNLTITTGEGEVRLLPVKPCPRCVMVNNDPLTAETSPAVLDALQRYRQDPRLEGALSFGMNVITLEGVGQRLRLGQAVAGNYRFED